MKLARLDDSGFICQAFFTMPDRSSKRKKRPRDVNALAASVVAEAVGDAPAEPERPDDGKDPAAVALGRKGGLKGGKARATKLSAQKRKEIARKAAKARWRSHQSD
ncbi:MAG TPA: hypothetical protein VM616_00400 [Gammaproteobacteria bacterium]|nr:hypothetical protein [Gammaproteobacteria bacterium]